MDAGAGRGEVSLAMAFWELKLNLSPTVPAALGKGEGGAQPSLTWRRG